MTKTIKTLIEIILVMSFLAFINWKFGAYIASSYEDTSSKPLFFIIPFLFSSVAVVFELWSRVKGNGSFWKKFF